MTFIEKGTPCLGCGTPLTDDAVVIETDDGQQVWHMDCLPEHVREQVEKNRKAQDG